jgi:hypothetical protein
VVYSHFGPQLNHLHSYAKNCFTDRHSTGWGPAVNLEGNDGAFDREFLIANALMWLRDYGFDGLRFGETLWGSEQTFGRLYLSPTEILARRGATFDAI